jgi:coatomer subunit beta'
MQVKINPHDTSTLASASLDRTIKVWKLGQADPLYTLEGHDYGVNCLDFCPKPGLLVSGSDDRTVKVWDLVTKTAVHTLEGHASHNITAVLYHPVLPILISAAEDGTCWFWDSNTYKAAMSLNTHMDRAWALTASKDMTVIGCDTGCICVSLGSKDDTLHITNKRVLALSEANAVKDEGR